MASTRCAHESRHRLPPAGCASSSQDAVSRSHFLQSVKPVDWGQSQHAVPLTVASHWCSVLGQWLFLALASVLVIRKHLLIIAASFSLVLFKVQTALLCFLIMKLIYAYKNIHYRKACYRKQQFSVIPTIRENRTVFFFLCIAVHVRA